MLAAITPLLGTEIFPIGNPSSFQLRLRAATGTRIERTETIAKTALDVASVTMRQRARTVAEQQKQAGAEQIDGVARAVHEAAREIEQKMPQAAGFIDEAATRLEGAAASLRERSVDDLIRSLNNFARTQPAVFFSVPCLPGSLYRGS